MDSTERLQYYEQQVLNLKEFPDNEWVMDLFRFQAENNIVYKEYLNLLGVEANELERAEDIPFLPIECFKKYSVKTGVWDHELIFSSSGTTGSQTSSHYVQNSNFYKLHSQNCFEHFYGALDSYCVLALLPAYLERKGSSLVYMAQHFIETSLDKDSGFFLYDWDALLHLLKEKQSKGVKTLLIGVSFALLDLAEQHKIDLSNVIVMETGGMKGRRKEMPRSDLHASMSDSFNAKHIHSEYGMTELLSQAYSKGRGVFELPPSMKFVLKDMTDPFTLSKTGKSGVLNIIDLANFASCSFIETADLAKESTRGEYEVLGRLDRAMLRGCNLLYTNLD
jgi:hypothetical protein